MRRSPWTTLAARSNVTVRLAALPSGVNGACRERDGHAVILLSSLLDQVERSITLAHELIHLDRGGGCPSGLPGMLWDPVTAREEAAVDSAVATDLLPADRFDAWIAAEVALDHQVDALLVSIEWAVPTRIAVLALAAAERRARLRHASSQGGLRCATVLIDGSEIHVQGAGYLSDEGRELLAEIVRRADHHFG